MVYTQRDSSGKLLRVSMHAFAGMTAEESETLNDISIWLRAQEEMRHHLEKLHQSDIATVRVLEDLITVLVEKNIIDYADLPATAREKLDERALVRADVEALQDTFHFLDDDLNGH
jgi:hypothetical protein